ncbi:MAG: hypothetical protein ACE5KT_07980 [Methanosarcinales archaeon]
MASKEKHIQLSNDFFALAEELLESDTYTKIAASAEFILVSLDHLVDAHLAYLGDFNIGRKWRYSRFKSEVLEDDTYILQEAVRNKIWHIFLDARSLRDALLYARTGKVYTAEEAKIKVKELIKDVKNYRTIIKNQVL